MSAGTSVPEQAARLVERAQKVALCLDFDGTLSPIVEDPQAARPLPGIVELLGPLAERLPPPIKTGTTLTPVHGFLDAWSLPAGTPPVCASWQACPATSGTSLGSPVGSIGPG